MSFLLSALRLHGKNNFLQIWSTRRSQALLQTERPLRLLAATLNAFEPKYLQGQSLKSQLLLPKTQLSHLSKELKVSCLHTTTACNHNEKSFALIQVLKEIKTSPPPALLLGLSGLIPFVSIPAYFLYGGTFLPDIAFAQLVYGASILSFLGGVRWGFTLPDSVRHELTWRNLGWSVTPSLLACVSILMPYSLGVLTVMTGLGGAAYIDLMYKAYPTWFKALRFCLSLIAVLSLWTSLVLSIILKQ